MGEIESAEAFASKLCDMADIVRTPGGARIPYIEKADVVPLIEARDNAVRLAAKREVLHELRNNYWGNRDTSWEAEAQKLLEKYTPTSGEKDTDGA